MALRIVSSTGVNLLEQPPAQVRVEAAPLIGGSATIQCAAIAESALPYDYITGTLNWNDGSLPVVYNGTTAGTLSISTTRALKPGNYTVRLEAHNYATPVWETVSVNFAFAVQLLGYTPPETPIVFGPILPKDTGYPNPQQWSWNRGTNNEILVSSVKMLLTTAKGERLMQPDYGTNLRLMLFEVQGAGIENLLQQEIVDALSKWEPRVELQGLTVRRTSDREVTVDILLVSRLGRETFNLPIVFTK